MRVLFVCTGNLCRSPMAEALLRRELETRGCAEVSVASAGTWAHTGDHATADAVSVLEGRGVDLSRHRARALEADDLATADLIVVMTSVHLREVLSLVPEAADRVVMLKEIAEVKVTASGREGAIDERVRALLTGSRPPRRRSLDLDDPMGLPRSAYERCVKDLEKGIAALAEVLCS